MIPIYAQRIREVRQAAGMTQTEFAAAVGTTKNQLSKYELGTQDTPTKLIIAVCNRFDIDSNWLLGLEDVDASATVIIANKDKKIEVNRKELQDYCRNLGIKAKSMEFIK